MSTVTQDSRVDEALENGVEQISRRMPAALSPGDESKIYRGRSVEELIPKIQSELGNDAIILRRRGGLTGGVGGFFQRQFVEIEACASHPHVDLYDESNERTQDVPATTGAGDDLAARPPAPLAPAPAAVPTPARPITSAPAEPVIREQILTTAQQRAYAAAYREGQGAAAQAHAPVERHDLPAAIEHEPVYRMPGDAMITQRQRPEPEARPEQAADIKQLLDGLGAGDIPPPQADPRVEAARMEASADAEDFRLVTPESLMADIRAAAAEPTAMQDGGSFAAALAEAEAAVPGEPVEERLLELGMGESLVKDLIETAATVALPVMQQHATLRDAVRLVLRLMIPMASELPSRNVAVAVVGPGGSGKSACCAGLLERGRESNAANVACATVSVDGRTGEHLLALGNQIPRPMPLLDPDVQTVLRATRQEGVLLFDMPAVSPADRRSVFSTAALLDSLSVDLVMMALPATLGAKPAAQMLRRMRALGASAMAITHADETDQLGVAVQAACAFGLAPQYLLRSAGNGGGLLPIDPAYLTAQLLP